MTNADYAETNALCDEMFINIGKRQAVADLIEDTLDEILYGDDSAMEDTDPDGCRWGIGDVN